MVGTLAGLRSADRASLDLVEAYGGGRWQKFARVQAFAAAPKTFAALKIAAPSAVRARFSATTSAASTAASGWR